MEENRDDLTPVPQPAPPEPAPQPEPDYLLIDTLLVMAARQSIRPVLVANKCDLSSEVYESLVREYTPLQVPILRVSAETGEGLDELRQALLDCAGLDGVQFDGGVITNARQADALHQAAQNCRRAAEALTLGMTPDAVLMDVEGAIEALGSITGQSVREDIIQDIFSRFCVGK